MCPYRLRATSLRGRKNLCQPKWPHFFEYDFLSSASDGLVDSLIWGDNMLTCITLLLMSLKRRANWSLIWVCSGGLVLGLQKGERSPEQECSHSIWKLLRRKAELMCGTGCCCELEQLLRN